MKKQLVDHFCLKYKILKMHLIRTLKNLTRQHLLVKQVIIFSWRGFYQENFGNFINLRRCNNAEAVRYVLESLYIRYLRCVLLQINDILGFIFELGSERQIKSTESAFLTLLNLTLGIPSPYSEVRGPGFNPRPT